MSTQISTAMVDQFGANIDLLSQQKGSRLESTVRLEEQTGENAFFDQIGATYGEEASTRHDNTPLMDTPHARRRVSLRTWRWADLIDNADQIRALASPASIYAESAAMAAGRWKDEKIIDAALGTAYTGRDGSTTVTLPASQVVPVSASGLTLAKLITAKEILGLEDADGSDLINLAVTQKQISDLLGDTTVTSADYAAIKALVRGDIDTFMGFKFHTVNGKRKDGTRIIPVDSSGYRRCVAYVKNAVLLSRGAGAKGTINRITERPDKNYSVQVFREENCGATRMEEVGVVEILCQE